MKTSLRNKLQTGTQPLRKHTLPIVGALLLWLPILIPFSTPTQANADKFATFKASNAISVYGDSVTYSIYRKGKKIGKHSLVFVTDGDALHVAIRSKITVRILKVPVFKFDYVATEHWDNEVLQSVTSTVTRKGSSTQLLLERKAGEYSYDNGSSTAATDSLHFASNHWHPGVLTASSVYNTLTGKINRVTIDLISTDTLTIGDTQVEANHYRYSGELTADVWYDSAGKWLQLQFIGEDGNKISYVAD